MKTSNYTCECGAIKGEANRWLLGVLIESSEADGKVWVSLMPWCTEEAETDDVRHFCSDQCALTWQARELERLGR